jgi:poly-gamma-glutamate capsule biosynthesis protein CapA/YwtB (metallophosphatase superfamily)
LLKVCAVTLLTGTIFVMTEGTSHLNVAARRRTFAPRFSLNCQRELFPDEPPIMPQHRPENRQGLQLMLGGDVMLGRNVNEYLLRYGSDYPLGEVASLMRQADVTLVNLECAITSESGVWPGAAKAFYFGASPLAVEALTGAGVDAVNLANNHALDYGVQGLLDTLDTLHRHGIGVAGAGRNASEALAPVIIDCRGTRLGMAGFCDHQSDFAAQADRPGIAWLNLDDEPAALARWRAALATLRQAEVDWPILSLHWGPNMVHRPSDQFRRLAHAAIDMGWKILFGHSAHVFQGIELYRGCPIIYAAGDLVDDYYVDPVFRNDRQLLFQLDLTQRALRRIELHPVFIEDCRTQPADAQQAQHIVQWMSAMCGEMGTRVQQRAGRAWIEA